MYFQLCDIVCFLFLLFVQVLQKPQHIYCYASKGGGAKQAFFLYLSAL